MARVLMHSNSRSLRRTAHSFWRADVTFVLTRDKLYDVVWSDPMTSSAKPIYVTLNQALQPLLTARTSGKRCTSPMKRASKGEVLSRRHARASRRATFKSNTGKMATVSGHRHRALPSTHPTPKPVDTRLRIVASFSPS